MKKLPVARLLLILTASFAAVVTYGVFLSGLEGQHTPYIDSTTNVLSIAAAILMLLRYREYWGFYIVVNAVSVVMWLLRFTAGQADALSMVVMWSAYLVNSVYGLTVWYRGTKNENSALSGKVRSVSPGS
jgi:nicotinamide mononucleotide transporter